MSGGIAFFANGAFVSGIGSAGVWVNNTPRVPRGAGIPATWYGELALYQSAGGTVRACEIDGVGDVEVSPLPATFIAGDSDSILCAWFLADGQTGVKDNRGNHWPQAGLLGLIDGVIFLKTSYQQGGVSAWRNGLELWSVPDGQPDILNGLPQFSALDVGRCLWTERGQIRTYGLPAPAQTEAAFDPFVLEAAGALWIGYHGGPVVLRRWDDASQGYVLSAAGGYYTAGRVIDGTHIEVAWSRGAEAAGDVETIVQDLTAPMVPLVPIPIPPEPIPVIGRALFAGWFTGADRSGLPGNAYLQAWQGGDGFVRLHDGTIVCKYIAASSDSDLAELNQRCADWDAHNTIPSLGYWTRKAQTIGVCTAKYVGVEAYCHAGENLSAFEAEIRRQMARVARPWLIAQCYTSNTGNTSDLEKLVPVYGRILCDLGHLLVFSGTDAQRGRATGYFDHPEVWPEWQELMAGIPGPPPVPMPPDPYPDPNPDPNPDPEEPPMKYGQKILFRKHDPAVGEQRYPDGKPIDPKAWIKGVVVKHGKDETYLDVGVEGEAARMLIYAVSATYPSGAGNWVTWNDQGEIGGYQNDPNLGPGGAERVTFEGKFMLVRPGGGKDGSGVAIPYDFLRLL
jgi:hypothetical protein